MNRGKGKGNQVVSPLDSLDGTFSEPQRDKTDVTVEDINNSIASGDPLNINTRQIYLEEVAAVYPEIFPGGLVNKLSLGFETTPLTDSSL